MSILSFSSVLNSAGWGKVKEVKEWYTTGFDDVDKLFKSAKVLFSNGKTGTLIIDREVSGLSLIAQVEDKCVKFRRFHGTSVDIPVNRNGHQKMIHPTLDSYRIEHKNNLVASGQSKKTPIVDAARPDRCIGATEEVSAKRKFNSNNGYGSTFEEQTAYVDEYGRKVYDNITQRHYSAAENALPFRDLTRKPSYFAPDGTPCVYDTQTPISVLNRDLNAGFTSEIVPLWEKSKC